MILWSTATAQVLIKAPQVPESVVSSALQEHGTAVPYGTWWLQQQEKTSEGTRLQQQFSSAEEDYVHARLKSAVQKYKEIIHSSNQADWTLQQRRLILAAYLRLASLEKDSAARKIRLQQAAQLDPRLEPDQELFPPPLIAEYKKVQTPWISVSTERWPPDISYILVNGRRVRRTNTLLVPSGSFRITWVGDSFVPFTRVLQVKDLDQIHFDLQYLVDGNCEQPHWNQPSSNYPLNTLVVYSENCTLDLRTTDSPVHPIARQTSAELALPMPESPPPQKKSMLESPWFWVVLGGLVGGVVIYQQSQNRSSPPTAKEGF
jgi:hypothetical protein